MKEKYIFIINVILMCALLTACSDNSDENYDAILEKSFSAAKEGHWDKANELAEKAVNINEKNPNARTLFALTLEQCRDSVRALEEATQAAMLDEDNFMAQYTKGRLLFLAERYDECLAPLSKASKIEPNNSQVLIMLARANAILGIQKRAIKYYIALLKQDEYCNRPEAFNELGVLFLEKNDFKHALSFLKKAYSMDEKSVPTIINMGILFDKYSNTLQFSGKAKTARIATAKALKYYRTALVYLQRLNIELEQQDKLKTRIARLAEQFKRKS